jgi:putrescine aminotransferase
MPAEGSTRRRRPSRESAPHATAPAPAVMDEREQARQQALSDYAHYVNAMKARVLAQAGLDIIEARREGIYVWDITGKRYIDCITSAGSFNVGRRTPEIVQALRDALDEIDNGIFLLCSAEKAALARRLAQIAPGNLECVMFGTGGGEVNDFAIKLARGYTMRPEIVYAAKGYHGHTGFSLAAAGRDTYREPFEPLAPGFRRVPFGDIAALERAINDQTAAVLLEPIQGEGGINIPPDDYLPAARRLCTERGALLILDEIQTGFGRTGKMFACEHWGITPDIMTLAKSLGGSIYPISAAIYTAELNDFMLMHPFIHLSTFGGSDLGCRVGLAVIDYIEQHNLCAHAAAMGDYFGAGLARLQARYPAVLCEVRRKGLMIGLQFADDSMGPRMSYQLAQRGIIAIYTGNEPSVMRLMPSLIIQPDEIDIILDALDGSLATIAAQGR